MADQETKVQIKPGERGPNYERNRRNRMKKKQKKSGKNAQNNQKNNSDYKPKAYKLRKDAIAKNDLITPSKSLINAQGILTTIPVTVQYDVTSLLIQPVGLISLAFARGLRAFSYSAYKVILSDFLSVANGGNGTAPSRFNYQNIIYGSIVPKTIPFRQVCGLKITPQTITVVPDPVIIVNGKSYYMYNVDTVGPDWTIQVAPPSTTEEEDAANYGTLQSFLGGRQKHNKVVRNITLSPKYLKDGSAFCRVSPYYGIGGGVGAPYCSTEFELPFFSNLLGTFTAFAPETPRVSRVFDKMSGDACSNYAIGVLDAFPTAYYRGAVPPIYKFLDLNELAAILAAFMAAARKMFTNNKNEIDDNNGFLNSSFSFTYQIFLLMLRQQVLWMFSDSQCLGQFQSFQTGTNSFRALLCGSNCGPQEPTVKMIIPKVLNENLKMLRMSINKYETKQYKSKRNHVTYIPVWGAFQTYSYIPEIFTNTSNVGVPLFKATQPLEGPDLWDGSWNGDVYDLNASQIITECVNEWNDWMQSLVSVIDGLEAIGGDACASPLLQYTRYVEYNSLDIRNREAREVKEKDRVPAQFKKFVTEVKLERTKSKGTEIRKIMQVPNSTVAMEWSVGYSGYLPITPTHKEYFPAFILPIIDISSVNHLPSQPQIQVSSLEGNYLNRINGGDGTENFFNSRYAEITSSLSNYVIGIAGKRTPMSEFITTLGNNNQGAFLGDFFSTIGGITSALGL